MCIALLLAEEFGEFVKFVIFAACEGGPLVTLHEFPCSLLMNLMDFPHVIFVKFASFTASLVLFYILPHCLLTNWANMPRLPHLSSSSHSFPAKALLLADEFDQFR